MQQRSIALTAKQWKEADAEAAEIGISVSEYFRRFWDAGGAIRKRLVERTPLA